MKTLFLLGLFITTGNLALAQDTTTVEGAEVPAQQEKVLTPSPDTAERQPQSVSKKKVKSKAHRKNKKHNKKKHHKNR